MWFSKSAFLRLEVKLTRKVTRTFCGSNFDVTFVLHLQFDLGTVLLDFWKTFVVISIVYIYL